MCHELLCTWAVLSLILNSQFLKAREGIFLYLHTFAERADTAGHIVQQMKPGAGNGVSVLEAGVG